MSLRRSNRRWCRLLLAALASTPWTALAEEFTAYHENVLGTALELRTTADTPEAASGAENRILREIDRLAAIFSNYDDASEFRRWQAAGTPPVRISPELLSLLRASDEWTARSAGAFDPRVEAYTRLWSACAKLGRLPTSAEWESAAAQSRRPAWRLDPRLGTAERLSDGPLSLDAIAKGTIIDAACRAALDPARGVHGVVLNIGGDLRVHGDAAQTVAVADPSKDSDGAEPLAQIELKNRAIATSSGSQRGFRIGGVRYSHIFDPRTGRPVDAVLSATAIAETAETADALATIFNVLPVADSLRLADSLPNVACLIVTVDGQTRSRGWPAEAKPPTAAPLLADARTATETKTANTAQPQAHKASDAWPDDFELLVSFEIQAPDGAPGRYRRPFVAVWVEDEAGASIRTLVLWAQKNARSQWVPDLRRWYRGDQARRRVDELDLRKTLSRATRPPGRYDVVWDGTDDHGRKAPAGVYTINIEAAREHGTYQIIRKRVTVANQPFVEDLKGNVEIKSAELQFRRRGPAR